MAGKLYSGPIIDAHHHVWDLSLGRHTWLTVPEDALQAVGDVSYLRRDYGVAEYLADIRGQNVVASVHVEAQWDRKRDPVEETRWLETLGRPAGIMARYVANASLGTANAAAIIERQADFARVVGLRESIRRHPDPAKGWIGAADINDPAWRRGVAHLGRHGLSLELLIYPHQADAVARLAFDFPDQMFVISHVASPVDQDPDSVTVWRRGLRAMSAAPNVCIKLSNYARYTGKRDLEGLRAVALPCIDAFGPERAMFGSDYPVARKFMSYGDICDRLKEIVRDFSADEQRAIFHDTAARFYRL